MAENNQWLHWLKCNVLEIAILVLVLVLLVKVSSAPVAENQTSVEELLAEESVPEVPADEPARVETPVEAGEEVPSEPAAEETLTE